MKSKEHISEVFARDVATHEMHIRLDEGDFRHVVFKRPNSSVLLFSLTTTPGRLIYGGDMGCFVFERTEDMFAFFRDRGHGPNMSYWHEKLVAVDLGGSKEPCQKLFTENLCDYDTSELTACQRREVEEFIEQAVDTFEDEGFEVASKLVAEHELDDGSEFFCDFFERSSQKFTTRYEWACHAIQWGIAQYDATKRNSNDTSDL